MLYQLQQGAALDLGWEFYVPLVGIIVMIALAVPVWVSLGLGAVAMLYFTDVLPLSLVGSFFILNFWCRLFCPVGLVLNEGVRQRRSLMKRIQTRSAAARKPEPAEPEDKGDLWRDDS